MELNENTSHNQHYSEHNQAKSLGSGLIASIVILSVLAGSVGGFAAGYYSSKHGTGVSSVLNKDTVLQEDSAVIDVVKKTSPAVVSIIISKNVNQYQNDFSNPFFIDPFFQMRQQPQNNTPNFQEVGAGSGFFVSPDGLVLTNKHVVSDTSAKYTVFTNDGKKYDAQVVATDPVNDLALVKVSIKNAPTLNLADSSKIQIGQEVIAIGNSLGQYNNTVTTGIVSGIGRNITAGGEGTSEQLEGVIQTDAAINPGNSGGPLLSLSGDVIGVNTAIDQQGQLVGFALPANDAKKDIVNYQSKGKITQPFLGVRYVLIDPSIQSDNKLPVANGAWVTSALGNTDSSPAVVPGSAADKAGIKDGDIITAVNSMAIDQNNSLAGLIKKYNPGDSIALNILRNGKNMTLNVTLAQQ